MFLGGLLQHGRDAAAEALAETAAVAYGVLSLTRARGARELQLVAAQDEIASPSRSFPVVRIR
ncbi:hypothetical protein GCM10027613_43840 [Microlunatus endophyticus]